jgi:hypothetical protein
MASFTKYMAMYRAVVSGDIDGAHRMAGEVDANTINGRGERLLEVAVSNMDADMVSELVRLGADVNLRNFYTGDTVLMHMSRMLLQPHEHPYELYSKDNLARMIVRLTDLGADPGIRARDGRTAARAVRAAPARPASCAASAPSRTASGSGTSTPSRPAP